jgi:hypothetical protein
MSAPSVTITSRANRRSACRSRSAGWPLKECITGGSARPCKALYRANVAAVTAYFARAQRGPAANLTADTFVQAITSFATFDPRLAGRAGGLDVQTAAATVAVAFAGRFVRRPANLDGREDGGFPIPAVDSGM